ncbi:hypothetical protein [Fervidobacterium sp.]
MRKHLLFFLIIFSLVTIAQGQSVSELLNVSRPSGVVAQPYLVRAVGTPAVTQGVYDVGLEAYIGLFGLHFSAGTTFQFPNFELNQPVYMGAGISLGGLFASLNSRVPNVEKINDITSYETPTVAFGIASSKKTSFLFASWSRVEISYETADLLKKANNTFVLNDSFDWTNGSATLRIESCDVGYFLFKFNVPSIKQALDGNFIYNWELALPVSFIYIYFAQPEQNSWLVGAGAAGAFFNARGTYNVQTGEISWFVSGQM